MARLIGLVMVFRIKNTDIDIDMDREQAYALYRDLRVALFEAPIESKPKREKADK